MNILNIALLQIAPCGSLEKNLEKGMDACRRAKEAGADVSAEDFEFTNWDPMENYTKDLYEAR